MEALGPWALSGLVLGSIFLPSSASTSFALERPVHLAATILVAVACTCIAIGRLLGRQSHTEIEQRYSAIPLEEGGGVRDHEEPHKPVSAHTAPRTIDFRRFRLVFVALILALVLRVEVFRRVVRTPQCKGTSYDTALPFALAVLDYVFVRRHETFQPDDENEHGSLYDVFVQYLARAPWRFLVTTAVYSASAFVVGASSAPLRSTYICPSTSGLDRLVPMMQHFGTVLDFGIAVCIGYLVTALHSPSGTKGPGKAFMTIGWAFAISAILIWIEGAVWFITVYEDRRWLFEIPTHFLWSTIKFDFLACVFFISFFASVHYIGVMASVLTISFTHITASALGFAWANLHPFPPREDTQGFVHFNIMFVSVLAFFASREAHKSTSNPGPRPAVSLGALLGVLVAFFILRSIAFVARTSSVSFHPIDLMIYDAQVSHENYVQQVTMSENLDQAVSEYKRRYGRNPPPAFDKWYEFAVERNSTIIDDYDNIYNDLLPFWSLPPSLLRHNLFELTSNPWNDVGGISVRDGKADISPNDMATHRWMLEGIVSMISQFEVYLPDMDLGFNMNDEPRVTVPYSSIQDMRRIGKGNHDHNPSATGDWSDDRADGWETISDKPLTYTPFTEKSFQRTFHEWGNSACPPSSPAATQNHWDVSTLCLACTNAHSLGAFLANWTLSADICAQPDMANLHGLYLSPAAFKASHDLLPVFSQSKAHGYNDILYPSAWNYMDKVAHAPTKEHPDKDYYSKSSTLFWRGATSEGVSPGTGTWTGMTRQRFLSVTNNGNLTTPVLLPYPFAARGKMSYTSAPISSLRTSITTNVALVSTIARCGEPDCNAQASEFSPLASPVDFQSHWAYKYLLDLDGAGFSGRFLPFLQSGSLPFKAALFREWFDDRLTPWVHFVPLDGRAHGLWATLMYFSGFEGWIRGKRVSVAAREKEGRMMANAGREWANRVLRKEDMEVYMFRLLLEWGRVTDDRRDELGFDGGGRNSA